MGFRFLSRMASGRCLRLQASDVKSSSWMGSAELHNVSIVLYGRDSSRFDQIYGDDFCLDPEDRRRDRQGRRADRSGGESGGAGQSGSIDAEGIEESDSLKTRDLVFNRETGNAPTEAQVEFRTPQASGWAVGVKYAGKVNTLPCHRRFMSN